MTTYLPGVSVVFDRFHVIKLYNDKLSELRRAMYHELKDTMQKDVLKGVRWLLLKRPENLDPTRNEPKRLREALRLKPGDKILVSVRGGKVLVLQKPKSYHAAIRGLARGTYSKTHLQKERQSWG